MEKPDNVTIQQIVIDSSENPSMGLLFGLGNDQKVYRWEFSKSVWVLAKSHV